MTTMNLPDLPPGLILIVGALLVPLFPGRARNIYVIALPALAFLTIWQLPAESTLNVALFVGFDELSLLRVDNLSKAFGYIFTLNAFAAFIYAFGLKDKSQHISALLYVGSALSVVFAGDLITLYIFWELMAVTSTFLILARKTRRSNQAAFRYIMVHIVGGLLLLSGILITVQKTGSTGFNAFADQNIGTWLILLGFLVNAAAPVVSAWLSDAYPEATVTGAVILSAYTTKTAVYTMVRGFPGWEILVLVGCAMTIYGIIYALLENDMRRILAYSIINQVGFMVTGIGIGSALALNGAVAHAFCHIIYKSLLWMSAGAVLHQVGKSKCTDLGGLYKTMPWTLLLGLIGALSISALPLTNGFTSKTLIMQGTADAHLFWPWLVLEIASAGVFLHAGIKFPYFVFFAKDKGLRPKEAPNPMLFGMGILAFLCIFIGIHPQPLYNVLPFEMGAAGEVAIRTAPGLIIDYNAYTSAHVVTQMQLLIFSALVFFLCLPLLKRTATISLDTDWFYRKGAVLFYSLVGSSLNGLNTWTKKTMVDGFVGRLIQRAQVGPIRLVAEVMSIYWKIAGLDQNKIDQKQAVLHEKARSGSFPIGVTAAFAALLMGILISL
jgi:multicomponent Na+:H+ antiporter subunit D